MRDFYIQCAKALYRRKVFVIGVSVAVTALAVVKELAFPPPHYADTLLVITSMSNQGEVAGIVPEPFSPKICQQLLKSTAVVGETLSRLANAGLFEDEEPPLLDEFMQDLVVEVTTVDQTTRPVNYSPLICISTRAETPEAATAIVDTWAQVAIEHAGHAVSLRLMGASETLERQKQHYEDALESIWSEIEKEQAQWNLDVLRLELDARVELLNSYLVEYAKTMRDLQQAEGRMALLDADLSQTVGEETDEYKAQLDRLWQALSNEEAQWDTDVLRKEIDTRVAMLNTLYEEKSTAERKLAGVQENLRMVREDLTQSVVAQEQYYKDSLDELRAKMVEEQSAWNTSVMQKELDTRVEIINSLYGEQSTLVRELARDEEELRMLRGAMTDLVGEEGSAYKQEIDALYAELIEEESSWNALVLQQELDTRVELLASLYAERAQLERDIAKDQERLRTTQQQLAALLSEEQTRYTEDLDKLTAALAAEMTGFNLEVIRRQVEAQLALIEELKAQQAMLEREVAGGEEGLDAVSEGLEEEQPLLELGRAPSDDAYWIAQGEGKKAPSLTNLDTKVMITQEVNAVHSGLKAKRHAVREVLATSKAQLDAVGRQLAQAREELEADKALLAEHEKIQNDLQRAIKVAETNYSSIATSETLALKREERTLVLDIAAKTATVERIREQHEEIETEQKELEALLAEHSARQESLRRDIQLAAQKYTDVATTEVLQLKDRERTLLMDIASKTGAVEHIYAQRDKIHADIDAVRMDLAEHEVLQKGLQLDTSAGEKNYLEEVTTERQALKQQERKLLLDVATTTASLQSIDEQITTIAEDRERLTTLLAEHKSKQDDLNLDISISKKRYDDVAAREHLHIKDLKRDVLLEKRVKTTMQEALDRDIEAMTKEIKEYESLIAEHELRQNRLKKQEELALKIFSDVAQAESFVGAAVDLAQGETVEGTKAVGLNRLSPETYAIEDKGLLGRKGRVAMAMVFALLCSVALVIGREVVYPMAREVLE